jgi:hypothetical protein
LGSNRDVVPNEFPLKMPDKPAMKVMRKFLAEQFTKDVAEGSEHLYKVSISIAEELLLPISSNLGVENGIVVPIDASEECFGGLIYPALAMRGDSDNICLLPNIADRHLEFVRAEYVLVQSVRDDLTYDVASLDHANEISSDGVIKWRGGPGKRQITAEGVQWGLRDYGGTMWNLLGADYDDDEKGPSFWKRILSFARRDR